MFFIVNISTHFLHDQTLKIIWYPAVWRHQHDVDIISDKEISVFDNNVNYDFSGVENFNKITIFNFEVIKLKII